MLYGIHVLLVVPASGTQRTRPTWPASTLWRAQRWCGCEVHPAVLPKAFAKTGAKQKKQGTQESVRCTSRKKSRHTHGRTNGSPILNDFDTTSLAFYTEQRQQTKLLGGRNTTAYAAKRNRKKKLGKAFMLWYRRTDGTFSSYRKGKNICRCDTKENIK